MEYDVRNELVKLLKKINSGIEIKIEKSSSGLSGNISISFKDKTA